MTSPEVLTLHDLHYRYPDRPIFSGANVSIRQGEFIGIIGPNGGGKTTLLKLILGSLSPQQGHILLFGQPHANALPQVGYVPQVTHFDTHFPISVEELVLMGRLSHLPWWGRFSTQDHEIALQALEQVGLSPLRHKPLNTLSGGQAQRALIARALASQPKLLLLDEPTANVDLEAAKEIYRIIMNLKGQTTVLMVTHELETVIRSVDRVLVVQNGIASLQPDEVCAHFAIGLYHPRLVEGSS